MDKKRINELKIAYSLAGNQGHCSDVRDLIADYEQLQAELKESRIGLDFFVSQINAMHELLDLPEDTQQGKVSAIRSKVEQLEVDTDKYHNQYHLCEAKLLSHKSITKQLGSKIERLKNLFKEIRTTMPIHCDGNPQGDYACDIHQRIAIEGQKE